MRVFWRVEMWCREQAAAAILPLLLVGWLTGQSSEALTTFGKSNTQAPPRNAAPTSPPARPCYRQSECLGISGTSCVRTQYDTATRCLCGDNQTPVNGQCEGTPTKNLYHTCANSDECNDGLICGPVNITAATAFLRVYSPGDKICVCDTDNGYVLHDHTCSGAAILRSSIVAMLFAIYMRSF